MEYWHLGDKYCDEDEKGDPTKWVCQKYNTMPAQLWHPNKLIEQSLFKDSGVHKNMKIKYLDIPMVHSNSKDGIKFIILRLFNVYQRTPVLRFIHHRHILIISSNHRTIPIVMLLKVKSLQWKTKTR